MSHLQMRTSERSSLKHCAQQWYWSTVEGLAPKRAANPLWFGSAIHEALASFYQLGTERNTDMVQVFLESLEGDRSFLVTNEEEELQYADARTLGIDMLQRYMREYEMDDNWDVIATEQTFQIWIKRPTIEIFGQEQKQVDRWLRYVGTVDGVYRDRSTGEIWLMEHKTAASIRVDHLPLDDQAGSYWALIGAKLKRLGILGPKEEIAGIMYNFLRKAENDPRPKDAEGFYTNKPSKDHYFAQLKKAHIGLKDVDLAKMTIAQMEQVAEDEGVRVVGERSKSQPPPYFERFPVYRSRGERRTQIRRIQDEAIYAEAYRNGWLPLTKAPDKQWCSWCPFRAMCVLDEQGDQYAVEEMKEAMYIRRDVYADHVRKSAEG